jgi:hypothetical protein
VLSPLLSNIYLHKLDEFVDTVIVPGYTRGKLRAHNPEYVKVQTALATARRCGDRATAKELRQQLRRLPSQDPEDPGYRRLHYVRYADLSRSRDKSAYAEDRIMPRKDWEANVQAGISWRSSA